jgi:hypothetical protein
MRVTHIHAVVEGTMATIETGWIGHEVVEIIVVAAVAKVTATGVVEVAGVGCQQQEHRRRQVMLIGMEAASHRAEMVITG